MTSGLIGRLSAAAAVVAACGTTFGGKYVPDTPAVGSDPVVNADVALAASLAGFFELERPSTLVYDNSDSGGSFPVVRLTAPVLLDEEDVFLNAAVVNNVAGGPLGMVSSFGGGEYSAPVSFIVSFSTNNGGDSNYVILEELQDPAAEEPEDRNSTSNSTCEILTDGTAVWRTSFSSFAGVEQNNVEMVNLLVGYPNDPDNPEPLTPGSPSIAAPDAGLPLLFGPGVGGDTSGSSFLSTATAERVVTGEDDSELWVGQSNFGPDGGTVTPSGVNVYVNDPATLEGIGLPVETFPGQFNWPQDQSPFFVDADSDDSILLREDWEMEGNGLIRQTVPNVFTVTRDDQTKRYVLFGIGLSSSTTSLGGNRYPLALIVDEIAGTAVPTGTGPGAVVGNGFEDGYVFIPADDATGPFGTRMPPMTGDDTYTISSTTAAFREHQATGGGPSPFTPMTIDVNGNGDIVTTWQDSDENIGFRFDQLRSSMPDVYQVRLYKARFDDASNPALITGYDAPIVIAESGTGIPSRGISYEPGIEVAQDVDDRVFCTGFLETADVKASPFSGAAIDDAGNVSFVGQTDLFVINEDFDATSACFGITDVPFIQSSTTSVFYYHNATDSLHIVGAGGQNGDVLAHVDANDPVEPDDRELLPGFFTRDDFNERFNAQSMSANGRYLAVTFRTGVENDDFEVTDDQYTDAMRQDIDEEGGVIRFPSELVTVNDTSRSAVMQPREQAVRGVVLVDVGDFVVPIDCPGDADGNGIVDLDDFSVLAVQFGTAGPEADFDGSGTVDLDDFSVLAVNFGTNCNEL